MKFIGMTSSVSGFTIRNLNGESWLGGNEVNSLAFKNFKLQRKIIFKKVSILNKLPGILKCFYANKGVIKWVKKSRVFKSYLL